MMRTASVAAFALLAVLAPLAAAPADARKIETAGFELELPAGARFRESYNGQVYFLEIRRPDVTDDGPLPLLRILVLPAGDIPPLVMREKTEEDLYRRIAGAGLTSGPSRAVRIRVVDREIDAHRIAATRDGAPVATFDVFGLEVHGQTMAGVAKARTGEDRDLLDPLLASLAPRKITKASLIRVDAAGVAFRVPIVTGFEWRNEAEDRALIGHLGLPEGSAQVFVQHCGTAENARVVCERAHAEQGKALARETAKEGGTIVRSTMTCLPVGDRVLVGSRHDLRMPKGVRRVATLFPVSVGPLFAGFTFVGDPAQADAMAERAIQILESVEGATPDDRSPNAFAGFGFDVRFERDAAAEVGADGVELKWTGPYDSPSIRFEVKEGPPPAAPEASGTTFPVSFLGTERAAIATPGGARATAPLGENHVVAILTGPEGDEPALRRAFAAMLARVSPATRLGHRVDAGPFSLGIDPVAQTAVTSGAADARTIRVFGTALEALATFAPTPAGAAPSALRGDAEKNLESLREESGERVTAFTPRAPVDRPVGDSTGAAALADVTWEDGTPGMVGAILVPAAGGTLAIEVRIRSEAPESVLSGLLARVHFGD